MQAVFGVVLWKVGWRLGASCTARQCCSGCSLAEMLRKLSSAALIKYCYLTVKVKVFKLACLMRMFQTLEQPLQIDSKCSVPQKSYSNAQLIIQLSKRVTYVLGLTLPSYLICENNQYRVLSVGNYHLFWLHNIQKFNENITACILV